MHDGTAETCGERSWFAELQCGFSMFVIDCLAVAADQMRLKLERCQDLEKCLCEIDAEILIEAGDGSDAGKLLRDHRSSKTRRHGHGFEGQELKSEVVARSDGADRNVKPVHRRAGHQADDRTFPKSFDIPKSYQ